MWRLIRSYVCHNHKIYYRQRNAHRSLAFAQNAEREWELIKPKEEEYDDEEEEEGESSEGEAAGGDGEEEE